MTIYKVKGMTKMSKKVNQNGFTLIEVLMAILILGIMIASTLQTITFVNTVSVEAREESIALSDAQSAFECIKDSPLNGLPLNATVSADSLWSPSIVSGLLAGEQILISGNSSTSLREITITVSWIGPRNKQKELQFVTLKA